MQASRCRPVFQSTELRQTLLAHTARGPGVKSKKGKIGGSGTPRRKKAKLAVRMQYGVLPYRFSQDAALEILLVTTRGTRRWIVPKGWPIKGLSPIKSAAREAFEEAGVTGRTGAKPIGVFAYDKLLDEAGGTTACEVKIYPLLVRRQSHVWPESCVARVTSADNTMGRTEQSDCHDQRGGPQKDCGHIRQTRRRGR